MAKLRAVILDVDGTLIASNDAHAHAYADAGTELGHDIPFDEVRPLIGKGGDKVLPEVTGIEEKSEEGKRISGRKGEIFRERYLPKLKPTPGARDLLLRLRDEGMKRVAATSANEGDVDGLLERAGITDLIESATSSGDAEASKPDPDIVQVALDQTGFPADQVMMIGDTPYDIEAAKGTGIPIIALRCGGWGDAGLEGAIAIYDDPADLLDHFEESPLV